MAARAIIAATLAELDPLHLYKQEQHEHNAAAIIARLANAEPPLLICTPDEIKE
jgi:hypothetical protein